MQSPQTQSRWYQTDEDACHSALLEQVRAIEEDQYEIAAGNYFNACLYMNRHVPGIDWQTHDERDVSHGPISGSNENIVTQVAETISALLGKNKPKPTPVVKDATFSVERMAQDLDRFLYGEFKRHDVYCKAQGALDTSLWAAIAGFKIDYEYDENGKKTDYYIEEVMPDEIIVDQREARYGKPLTMYQRKLVPREVLKLMYPEFDTEIETAGTSAYTSYRSPQPELVVVVEAWRLAYLGQPGRHTIAIENATLLDEEYKRDKFPFVWFKWFQLPGSFYSRPLVEDLMPGQLRYNELDFKIRLCQDIVAVPRFIVDQNVRMSVEQLDNSIAKVIRSSGG